MRPSLWPSFVVVVALNLAVALLGLPAAGAEPGEPGPAPPPGADERIARMLAEIERASAELDAAAERRPAALAAQPGAFPLPPEAAARAEALARYAETGEPPILGLPTRTVYPFGHETPVVRCLPLRACDLAFEAGERLAGWALGDTERWLVAELAEGAGETAVPHLLLKPTDFELATNLVVVTDRRTYHLELESPPAEEVHGEAGDVSRPTGYDGQLSWWYPDEFVREARERRVADEARAAAAARRHREAVALDVALDPGRLSFAYEIRRPWRPSRRLGWGPVTVFDDGRRVYLRLPPAAHGAELPVVLGVLDGGDTYPLDARLDGDWLIVPALFERAELVVGTGEKRRSLTVVAGRRGEG
jgi:type IV secretion system protein VirB9